MRVLVVDENCKWCKGNGKKSNGQPCGYCLRAVEIEAVRKVSTRGARIEEHRLPIVEKGKS